MDSSAIPIDIHYNKLLDWLLNRRHCGPQWQSQCLVVREKINNAIQDMPEHPDIRTLLAGTYINYFHCLRIVEILRDTEKASKNFFGRYSSQRMKDWQEIVRDYEKDEIYLGEAAQLLTRSVNYEIPALKRQIKQCQQQQTDCSRKEKEYAANSAELKSKYASQCKKMHIEGKQIRKELMTLVKDLPQTYEKIAAKVKDLSPFTEYYTEFTRFTLNKDDFSESTVPMIKYMCTHGDTIIMQYRTGVVPTRVEPPIIDFGKDEEEITDSTEEDTIDFGEGEIDFDIQPIVDSGTIENIDFGDQDGDGGIDYGEIDFGEVGDIEIEVIEGSNDKENETTEEGVAKGTDAMTLLDNVATRNEFINELIELQCFFTMRLQEMRSSGDPVSASIFQSAPALLQKDLVEVEKMLAVINDIHSQLTNERIQDLMLIRSSPSLSGQADNSKDEAMEILGKDAILKQTYQSLCTCGSFSRQVEEYFRYVDRLTDRLKNILSEAEKQMSLSRLMVTRREEARTQENDLHPQLKLVREKMKELKTQIEEDISKKYKNRKVNIMGEINTI